MSFKDTRIEHERSPEAGAWLEEEVAEQEARYQAIVAEMEALNEQREKWIEEFFDRLQNYGFNEDGDRRVKIPEKDLPVKPDRPHKVVF